MKLEEAIRLIVYKLILLNQIPVMEETIGSLKLFSQEVADLREEITSIDPHQATVHDYEQLLIKMGELILNDLPTEG